ncbi:hypothetical protein C0J52_25875 [Blattella germanica]|nr:hypothetical protein C0J52_25875 [Blattella germanica]
MNAPPHAKRGYEVRLQNNTATSLGDVLWSNGELRAILDNVRDYFTIFIKMISFLCRLTLEMDLQVKHFAYDSDRAVKNDSTTLLMMNHITDFPNLNSKLKLVTVSK